MRVSVGFHGRFGDSQYIVYKCEINAFLFHETIIAAKLVAKLLAAELIVFQQNRCPSAKSPTRRIASGKSPMPKTSLVLTILGQDRPGLVDSIAQTVAEHSGNWVESRMARLAGQFAGILRVEVDAEQAEALISAISLLSEGGLKSTVLADAAEPDASQKPAVQLSLVGQDRPGIVREISRVLATLGVNVEELHTETLRAATTGQTLFQAEAELRLPEGVSTEALREALEAVAADLMVDLSLS